MALTRLQDDLLQEFREEKKLIYEQIDLFDPLGVSLRKPAAQRLTSKGLIIFGEVVCWLAVPGLVALGVFLPKLYPTYLLFQLNREEYSSKLGHHNIQMLHWTVYGMLALMGLLFIFIARALARIRQKNDVLYLAGRNIKSLVGQHLNRKAAIEAIEQRHFMELPLEPLTVKVNEVKNPGFDEPVG